MIKIIGTVVRGKQKGRQLGFPTANVEIKNIDLEQGIYAGTIIVGGKKHGCAVYYSGEKFIEAFIFDFSEDLYGKEVIVEVLEKIRDKQIFETKAEAIEQITKDTTAIKELLRKLG